MKKYKLSINIFMFILLAIACETIINDLFTYIFNPNYLVSTIISIILISITSYLLINKKIIKIVNDFNKEDLIFLTLVIIIFLAHIPFADEMYDTINYHLYLQERPFTSKIFSDFFPGRYLNTYSYSLPDRMFYLFRYFLGYRLGVILNYLILFVLYYQVKKILKNVLKTNNVLIALMSTFVVLNLSVLEQIDNYYVDLLSLVFLLECFKISFVDDTKSFKFKTIYYMFICGLSFCVKISNAFFIIVFSILYLINNLKDVKKVKIKDIILFLLAFILPFSLYMIYTYIETKNPVFPFYNSIFKSPYFRLENWMDTRFGPKRILELFFWPIVGFFNPNRVADTSIMEPMWAIGYVVSILYIIYSGIIFFKKKKINKKLFTLSIIVFLLYFVWSKFLLGYTRYAIIVVLISSVFSTVIFYKMLNKKKYIIFSILLCAFVINAFYTGQKYLYSNANLFYDNILNNDLDSYSYNIKHLFDRNENIVDFETNSAWGIIAENSGECLLINNELDMLNLTWGADTKKSKKILNDNLDKYNHLYTCIKYDNLDYFFNRLNDFNYDIVDVYATAVPSNLENKGLIYVFEIKSGNYIDSYSYVFDKYELKKTYNIISNNPYIRSKIDLNNINLDGKKLNYKRIDKYLYSFDIKDKGNGVLKNNGKEFIIFDIKGSSD